MWSDRRYDPFFFVVVTVVERRKKNREGVKLRQGCLQRFPAVSLSSFLKGEDRGGWCGAVRKVI